MWLSRNEAGCKKPLTTEVHRENIFFSLINLCVPLCPLGNCSCITLPPASMQSCGEYFSPKKLYLAPDLRKIPALYRRGYSLAEFEFLENIMARVCQVTGKRPMSGNNVSHAKNRTRRRFLPNLHFHRFWVESEKRFIRLRLTSKGMRIIDKKGIDVVLADMRARGEKV